jgi:hypothetical protein
MFTTVSEDRFRNIARVMVSEGSAPPWFAETEYIAWHGETKNLEHVPGTRITDVLLIDDYEGYIHTGQESQWMQIGHFGHPYPETDTGFAVVMHLIEERLGVTDPVNNSV